MCDGVRQRVKREREIEGYVVKLSFERSKKEKKKVLGGSKRRGKEGGRGKKISEKHASAVEDHAR